MIPCLLPQVLRSWGSWNSSREDNVEAVEAGNTVGGWIAVNFDILCRISHQSLSSGRESDNQAISARDIQAKRDFFLFFFFVIMHKGDLIRQTRKQRRFTSNRCCGLCTNGLCAWNWCNKGSRCTADTLHDKSLETAWWFGKVRYVVGGELL